EEVIKIRINGINEIKNVKVKYASIKKFESIKHLEFVINTKKDNEILREEYNQQIEKLKYLKIKEQRELEKGLDSYNFNVYHQLNELEKTYNLEENKIIDKYYQQIADYQKQMFLKMKEKQKQKNEDVSLIHLQIKDLDNLNLNEYLDALKRNLNHSKQSFYTYHKFFLEVITLFQEKLISLVNNLNRELNTLDNYKYLLSTTYKQTYSFEYSEYQGNLEKITEKFINNQKQTEKEFLKLLESNFDAILNAIKNLVNNFELFVKEQTNNINKFYNDLFGLVNLVFSDSTKLKEEQFASDALITNESINKMKAEMDNLINELEEKNSNVFTEYQNKNLSLKERIKEYNISLKKEQKKELAQYNNAIKNIKNNISKIKRKYRKEKQEARKEINRKFNQDIKEFEQEKKTKLKIGQI
ncbi:MAG TPA: hypothetical protein GXZ48_00995, partial [Acholeplasmataceae bacterium]|nr:hypothetical protein [Acholeplasmataceae bacterium]